MDWGAVWKFVVKIFQDNPQLLAQIIEAILKAVQRDPKVAGEILNGLILKK